MNNKATRWQVWCEGQYLLRNEDYDFVDMLYCIDIRLAARYAEEAIHYADRIILKMIGEE